ncbi:MAG: hypothetical protein ACRETS_12445, partial [Steroidobacteraceae bacterium]
HHLALHNRRQFARRQTCENQLRAAQELSAAASRQLAALEGERAALTRLWHYFRRRALERRIAAAEAAAVAARASFLQAQAALEALGGEAPPEFPGLSLPARRAINLAAIAYAEVLCARLQVMKTPLVTLAREATGKRAASDEYGTPRECVMLMAQIQRAQGLIGGRAGLAAEIRARTERLRPLVRYRGAADTAPLTDSIDAAARDALDVAAQGSGAARVPNVLAEDTWDLFRVLLR